MRVYLDTNILMDYLLPERPCYEDATRILEMAKDHMLEAFISTQSILDAYYSAGKFSRQPDRIKHVLHEITRFINVVDIHVFGVRKALASDERDVEDLAQAATAEREGCDVIITNDKDFPDYPAEHPLKTMSSRNFVDVCRRAS